MLGIIRASRLDFFGVKSRGILTPGASESPHSFDRILLLQSFSFRRIIPHLFAMDGTNAQLRIGRQVSLPGHFDPPMTLESAHPLGNGFEYQDSPVRWDRSEEHTS